jgi:hypothetical protein
MGNSGNCFSLRMQIGLEPNSCIILTALVLVSAFCSALPVCACSRKYVIHVERINREKNNGATVPLGIHPSNVVITKLHLDPDRKALLDRKNRSAVKESQKGKVQEAEVPHAALD